MFQAKSTEPFRVVSVNDPAIDRTSAAGAKRLREYMQERDIDRLLLRPGHEPSMFVCQPISRRAKAFLDGLSNGAARDQYAFQISVTEVLNGPAITIERDETGSWGRGIWIMTDECADKFAEHFGTDVLEEVGSVAFQRAALSAHQKKAYRLPPGFKVNWEGSSSAAASPTTSSSESQASGSS